MHASYHLFIYVAMGDQVIYICCHGRSSYLYMLPWEIKLFIYVAIGDQVIYICCHGRSSYLHMLPLEIKLLSWGGGDPINWFNPAILLCLSQAKTWISNIICRSVFCAQWVKVRGDCSFCQHSWNWWPSLFKHSFHN